MINNIWKVSFAILLGVLGFGTFYKSYIPHVLAYLQSHKLAH